MDHAMDCGKLHHYNTQQTTNTKHGTNCRTFRASGFSCLRDLYQPWNFLLLLMLVRYRSRPQNPLLDRGHDLDYLSQEFLATYAGSQELATSSSCCNVGHNSTQRHDELILLGVGRRHVAALNSTYIRVGVRKKQGRVAAGLTPASMRSMTGGRRDDFHSRLPMMEPREAQNWLCSCIWLRRRYSSDCILPMCSCWLLHSSCSWWYFCFTPSHSACSTSIAAQTTLYPPTCFSYRLEHLPLTKANRDSWQGHPEFLYMGIVPYCASGQLVFSGISHFPCLYFPVLLHTHLVSYP
ncbi:hypothetical protein PR048_004559 [Dryococelus australis]|uniref:Uncharacterized protein n=1 Tax=Dryococelus australis TaxID=614101 RepID=A0ABQ9I5Q7_9NEOP|nr:hypothetical protein PR048_004559 [Dryococelus australis]